MKTQRYLSKETRQPDKIRCQFTERDVDIIRAVNRYRYLRTGQINRLLFSGNTTIQSARRRLRCLYHHGYLGVITPLIQVGQSSGESAYFLDKTGIALLQDYGEEIRTYPKANQVKHPFLNHALDLSEFHLNLELALRNHSTIALHRFTCDFEVKSHTQQAFGHHIYKLYTEVRHPVDQRKYIVYPDALIILRGQGDLAHFQKLYFLEVDRGTEALKVVQDKVIGFNLYLQQGLYQNFGPFDGFRVLIQTCSKRRAENIRQHLTDQEGSHFVWITTEDQVSEQSILTHPIWLDHEWKLRSLTKADAATKV